MRGERRFHWNLYTSNGDVAVSNCGSIPTENTPRLYCEPCSVSEPRGFYRCIFVPRSQGQRGEFDRSQASIQPEEVEVCESRTRRGASCLSPTWTIRTLPPEPAVRAKRGAIYASASKRNRRGILFDFLVGMVGI